MGGFARRALLCCAAALSGAAALACDTGLDASLEGEMSLSVEALRIEPRTFAQRVELLGALEAEESVVIRPEIEGVIEKVEFLEGETVAAAAVLFVLRDADQRAAVREAEAQLTLARDVFSRTRKLSEGNVAAASELTRARAQVEVAEALLERARINLDRTRIRAPFDGALGARGVSPGDRVDSESELVQLAAVDRLKLFFSVPEVATPLARPGLTVEVSVAAFPDEHFPGEVYFVSPFLDPDTRRLGLKARVENSDGRLRPGMFARLELEMDPVENALLVPEGAVVHDAAGTFVWRVGSEQRVERVQVELASRADGEVLVRSGLEPGDVVVTAGVHKLFPGTAVSVRETPPELASKHGGS